MLSRAVSTPIHVIQAWRGRARPSHGGRLSPCQWREACQCMLICRDAPALAAAPPPPPPPLPDQDMM